MQNTTTTQSLDFLDLDALDRFLTAAVEQYETSAPTVAAYCESLYQRTHWREGRVTFGELLTVRQLCEDGHWEHPNYAANRIYKLESDLGRDTTGHAGF